MKQLIESVYSKLNYVNTFCDSDADILAILNGEPQQSSFAGSGSNNEFALNEISQWLEERHMNHIPVSMGDVQRRYQAIPYGWREIDIAALVARLIVNQKIEIRYGGAVVSKDDKNIVRYLRVKTEIDKVSVSRRIAPSEEDMRKAVKFLRDWLGQMSIAEDEDGLVTFIKGVLTDKKNHYDKLIEEYNNERYPDEEVVIRARDLMNEILSQKNDNVALIKRLLVKQDDLINVTEDMEEVEVFFKSQKEIFNSARKLLVSLQNEIDYFTDQPETRRRINEISDILEMQKPYKRIKDLPDLMQGIKKAYADLLEKKKEKVQEIIDQFMNDIHSLAGSYSKTNEEVEKSDEQFNVYKQKASAATSLTLLDAMITQMQSYKDQVHSKVEAMIHEDDIQDHAGNEEHRNLKIVYLKRNEVFPAKQLSSQKEVDSYLELVREKLYKALESNDGIQIN